VLLLYVVQFSSYLMPLITLPYLARVLSPEKFGLVAYSQSMMWYFVTLTDYSFNLSATRRVAIHRDDKEELSRIFSSVMTAKTLLTLLGFAILMGTVFAIPKLRANWVLFPLSFLTVTGSWLFPLWLFQGLQRLEQLAIRDFLAKLLGIIALFVLVHRDSDYVMAAAVQGGSVALAGLIGLVSVPFVVQIRWRPPTFTGVQEVLASGWPLFLSLGASSLAMTNVFIMGLYSPPAEVGYYSGAQRLIGAIRALVTPIVTAVYPHVSVKAGRSEREAVRFIQRYAVLLSGPFLLIGIAIITAGPWVIRLVLGNKYGPSIPVIQVLALSPFLLALSHVYSTYYMLTCGYDKAWTKIMLTGVALNFVVLFPLLYWIRGSLALAVSSLIVDVATTALYWRFYSTHAPRTDAILTPVPEDDAG
jgi:PST family polysaccharide transporter